MLGKPNSSGNDDYLPFIISGIYLILVGVTGGFLNVIAFVKAYQVKTVQNLITYFESILWFRYQISWNIKATFLYLTQAQRTKFNIILINLIVSDLFIIFVGIPIDAVGAFTMGNALDKTLCSCVAFTHTLFGKIMKIAIISLLPSLSCIENWMFDEIHSYFHFY